MLTNIRSHGWTWIDCDDDSSLENEAKSSGAVGKFNAIFCGVFIVLLEFQESLRLWNEIISLLTKNFSDSKSILRANNYHVTLKKYFKN